MEKINRRSFCKNGISAACALSMPGLLYACSRGDPEIPPGQGINARVAAVKGQNLDPMTRDAIEAIGGMKSVVNSGETVFIKPNFVSFPWAEFNNCFHAGECTKPEVIIAVAEECLKAGATRVIIGDGSHLPSFDWQYAVTLDGSTDLVSESNRLNSKYDGTITLACLENDTPEWIDVPSDSAYHKISISGLVTNADKVISVPVAKTHSWAQLTLAAKNFVGITPLSKYAQLIDNTWFNRGSVPNSVFNPFLPFP